MGGIMIFKFQHAESYTYPLKNLLLEIIPKPSFKAWSIFFPNFQRKFARKLSTPPRKFAGKLSIQHPLQVWV